MMISRTRTRSIKTTDLDISKCTRTVFRVTALDLLDLESGGGTVWGRTAAEAADMIAGLDLPDLTGRTGQAVPAIDTSWRLTRAIVRIARACMSAFTAPFVDQVSAAIGNPLTAASLVGTPFAYYRQWWRPPAATGGATTRKMTPDDAERRAQFERALKAQRAALDAAAAEAAAAAADRWRHAHEDVTKVQTYDEDMTNVRTAEPAVSERPTRPYSAVRPK